MSPLTEIDSQLFKWRRDLNEAAPSLSLKILRFSGCCVFFLLLLFFCASHLTGSCVWIHAAVNLWSMPNQRFKSDNQINNGLKLIQFQVASQTSVRLWHHKSFALTHTHTYSRPYTSNSLLIWFSGSCMLHNCVWHFTARWNGWMNFTLLNKISHTIWNEFSLVLPRDQPSNY